MHRSRPRFESWETQKSEYAKTILFEIENFFLDSDGNLKILIITAVFMMVMFWTKVLKAETDCRNVLTRLWNLYRVWLVELHFTKWFKCTLRSDNEECFSIFDYFLFGTFGFGFPFCAYQMGQIWMKDEARQDAEKLVRIARRQQRAKNRTLLRSKSLPAGHKPRTYQVTK